jgi:hypothetical protein
MNLTAPFDLSADVDFIEELRLRRWARENYCFAEARLESWHPIIHDEMRRRDAEGLIVDDETALFADAAPLPAESPLRIQPAAITMPGRVIVAQNDAGKRLVPLPPDLAGLHGPHEITPPHTRVAEGIETAEMHYT